MNEQFARDATTVLLLFANAVTVVRQELTNENWISVVSGTRRVLLLASIVALFCLPTQAKRKDVVIMNNGDHCTGQVRRLQNGLLYIETDYVSGDIGLDWNQVRPCAMRLPVDYSSPMSLLRHTRSEGSRACPVFLILI